MINKSAADEIPNLLVSPLGAIVNQKVRTTHDFSFDAQNKNKKEE